MARHNTEQKRGRWLEQREAEASGNADGEEDVPAILVRTLEYRTGECERKDNAGKAKLKGDLQQVVMGVRGLDNRSICPVTIEREHRIERPNPMPE